MAILLNLVKNHFGIAFNVGGLVDVHQNTFQVSHATKDETDGEIESWIYE